VIIEEALMEYAESPAARDQVLETLGRVRLARAAARQELLDEAALIRSLKENRDRAGRRGTFWEKPDVPRDAAEDDHE
jgi:hypothetical protein